MAHTILVIDADPMQQDLLCTVLTEKLGYKATGVADSRAATHMLMSEDAPKPDLILFDIAAVADGCSAITNLRILTVHTPIVALVKYGDYETATAAIASGAQDFLAKPVALERLGATLHNALRLRDIQNEISHLRREHMQEVYGRNHAGNPFGEPQSFALVSEDGNIRRMEQIEAEIIRFAMQHYKGRMTEVARRLGIGRSTLYRKLSELNVRQQVAA